MRQHYTPQVYLRQWCNSNGHLVRYCRVGPPGRPHLHVDRKAPKEICWEHDLYSVPDGGIANGKTGDELETLLSAQVEAKIVQSVVEPLRGRSGLLEAGLASRVKWLMQTFVARSRSGLKAVASSMTQWAEEERPTMLRVLERAQTPSTRAELSKYLDPRMPAVAALAKLAAVIENNQKPVGGWYTEGTVVLAVNAGPLGGTLAALGLDHFPTFDEPVVEWQPNALGIEASFSVSPGTIAFVVQEQATEAESNSLALAHLVQALPFRRSAICRSRARAGVWLGQAQRLAPFETQSLGPKPPSPHES